MKNNYLKKAKLKRGIYLLPNIFTTAGLFAGFYAIIHSMMGNYENAAVAIFIAMIMDSFDGRVARMTNTESAFGGEYDSLADMVSFAVAPAIVTYNWALTDLGKAGWLASFVFVACGALRLARFNTQIGVADKRYFQGLPSPAAAAILCGMVWSGMVYHVSGQKLSSLVALITIVSGLLMVSNIRYHSFKQMNWKEKVPFVSILIFVLLFVAIAIEPPIVLFVGFSIYAVTGVVLTIWQLKTIKSKHKNVADDSNEVNSEKPIEK